MKRIAMLLLPLAACAPQPEAAAGAGTPTSTPTADPLAACDGAKAKALIGRPVDAALKAEAMRLVGARTLRVIPPGAMVTMDYRTDRLNIDTDADNRATAFRCG
jgi:hypothetical protein